MKKQTRRSIFIVLGIVFFIPLILFIIGLFSDDFGLERQVTKDYKIKHKLSTDSYNLYDGDHCAVEGINIWILDKEFIHGCLKNSEYSYFIYNNKTKQTFYFKEGERRKYKALVYKWSIRDFMGLSDNIENQIWGRHEHLFVEEQEEFKTLSPEMKIEKIIETCVIKRDLGSGPKFYDYLNLITDEDEMRMAPVLLDKLDDIDLAPEDFRFRDTANAVIYELCMINRFCRTENKQRFLSILEKKLDRYLKQYKVVDGNVVELDNKILSLQGLKVPANKWDSLPDEALLKKYTDMGYKDLKIKKD